MEKGERERDRSYVALLPEYFIFEHQNKLIQFAFFPPVENSVLVKL